MTDIKMLPLPGSLSHWLKMRASDSEESAVMHVAVHHHARAVAEHNVKERDAEIERLRAEREVIGAEAVKYADKSGRLQAELDNRWAQGVHTCHDKCQRIACVLRRDNERLTEALRMIEKDSPVEAPDLNDWADADERVDVVENNLRWHFGKIARAALAAQQGGES